MTCLMDIILKYLLFIVVKSEWQYILMVVPPKWSDKSSATVIMDAGFEQLIRYAQQRAMFLDGF